MKRFTVEKVTQVRPVVKARINIPNDSPQNIDEKLLKTFRESLTELTDTTLPSFLGPKLLKAMRETFSRVDASSLPDIVCGLVELSREEKLDMLSTFDAQERLRKSTKYLRRQIQVMKITANARSLETAQTEVKRREQALRTKLENIKRQLKESGAEGDGQDEVDALAEKIESGTHLSVEAKKVAKRELKRLKSMNPANAEGNVIRNYLDWITEIQWLPSPSTPMNMRDAETQLNSDHYGLQKVKKRIMEYLAVVNLKGMRAKEKIPIRSPILCLVGPPGVGKTSLGKSIAKALNRDFYRVSLGGVNQESEIKGHRRTYVAAMPGLIAKGIAKSKVRFYPLTHAHFSTVE